MQPRLRATLVIAAIAIASGIAGAAIDRTFLVHAPHHGPRSGSMTAAQAARRRAEMLDRMTSDLTLSAAQRTAIDSVFQRTDSAMRAIRQESEPRVRAAIDHSRIEIAARLDSAQREKFARLSAERDRRRASRP